MGLDNQSLTIKWRFGGEEWSMKEVEQYMTAHKFLNADKKKVRDFLQEQRAVDAFLTRKDLYYLSSGIWGVISRSQLGLQSNFV